MASKNSKTPPSLKQCKSYDDWTKMINMWRVFTDLPKEKQGPALFLSLEGEAQDAVLELDEKEIIKDTGVETIIKRLDRLFKKDSVITKYLALEKFESFKRPPDMSIQTFLNEFKKTFIQNQIVWVRNV